MTVFISEHAQTSGAHFRQQVLGPPLVSYSLTSASTPTLPNANTNFIRVTADAGSFLNFYSSSTSALGLTSTNSMHISGAATGELFALASGSPLSRIQVAST